jgi:hypothetical protein
MTYDRPDPVLAWTLGGLLSIGLAAGLTLVVTPGEALGGVAILNVALGLAHYVEAIQILYPDDEEEEAPEAESAGE